MVKSLKHIFLNLFRLVSALAFSARGPRFDPRSRRGKFRCPNTLSLVSFAGMTLDKCIDPSVRDVNLMSPVQGESPIVQVKEPNGNLDKVTCRLSSCNPECTNGHLSISLAKQGSDSIYKERKKDKSLSGCHIKKTY